MSQNRNCRYHYFVCVCAFHRNVFRKPESQRMFYSFYVAGRNFVFLMDIKISVQRKHVFQN